jgi:hypothetical protein
MSTEHYLRPPSSTASLSSLSFLSKLKLDNVERHILTHAGKEWHMPTPDMRSFFGETLYDRRDSLINIIDSHYVIGKISMTRQWKPEITMAVLDKYGCSLTSMTNCFYDRDTTFSLTSTINKEAVSDYHSTISNNNFTVEDYENVYGKPTSTEKLQHRILYSKLLLYERDTLSINYYSETLNEYGNRLHDHVPDSPLSIIRTPSELRSIAYSGQGLADFDIEACFPSLLQNILIKNTGACPYDAINQYIEQKNIVRMQLAGELNIPVHASKQIFNAVLFGATAQNRPLHKRKNLRDILHNDTDKIALLKSYDFLKKFRRDLKHATQDLIRLHRDDQDTITCALGNSVPQYYESVSGKKQHVQYSRLLFFILSSYETAIMQSIVQTYGSRIKALVYDGFIADNMILAQELSDHVNKHFGFNIRFSKKSLQLPRNCDGAPG